MYKKDMIWIATAKLLYPRASPSNLVTEKQIVQEISSLFQETITPVMLRKHLVSWEGRQVNPEYPPMGGGRYRYLFRTEDGISPSEHGDYRLYKARDSQYDGSDKTSGETYPQRDEIPEEYHYLLDWYGSAYFLY